MEQAALKRRDELAEIELKYMNQNDEEENDGIKTLLKQAGKYKKELEFKPFVSTQLQQLNEAHSIVQQRQTYDD